MVRVGRELRVRVRVGLGVGLRIDAMVRFVCRKGAHKRGRV